MVTVQETGLLSCWKSFTISAFCSTRFTLVQGWGCRQANSRHDIVTWESGLHRTLVTYTHQQIHTGGSEKGSVSTQGYFQKLASWVRRRTTNPLISVWPLCLLSLSRWAELPSVSSVVKLASFCLRGFVRFQFGSWTKTWLSRAPPPAVTPLW